MNSVNKSLYRSEKMVLLFFFFSVAFSLSLGYPIRWGAFSKLIVIFVALSPIWLAFLCFYRLRGSRLKASVIAVWAGIVCLILPVLVMKDFPSIVQMTRETGKWLTCAGLAGFCFFVRPYFVERRWKAAPLELGSQCLVFVRHWLSAFLLICAYTTVKSLVPIVTPRLYDDILEQVDKVLFWGLPNQRLLEKIPFEWAPYLSFGYQFFFILVLIGFSAIYARYPDKYHFRKLTVSVCFCYVFGLLLYYLIPSIGPAYRHPELFSRVLTADMAALQSRLWGFYIGIQNGPEFLMVSKNYLAKGVAAFPSLHIAMTVIILFYLSKHARGLFILLLPPSIAMGLATVYFGWHYFVDDIAGVLLAASSLWITEKTYRECSNP